jgi:hypothetical protein
VSRKVGKALNCGKKQRNKGVFGKERYNWGVIQAERSSMFAY